MGTENLQHHAANNNNNNNNNTTTNSGGGSGGGGNVGGSSGSSSSSSNRMLSSRARALELHRLGFQAALESLVDDVELDVKERSRIALTMLKKHMSSV